MHLRTLEGGDNPYSVLIGILERNAPSMIIRGGGGLVGGRTGKAPTPPRDKTREPYRPLPLELGLKVEEMIRAGATCTEIRQKLMVSYHAVYNRAVKLGITLPRSTKTA